MHSNILNICLLLLLVNHLSIYSDNGTKNTYITTGYGYFLVWYVSVRNLFFSVHIVSVF